MTLVKFNDNKKVRNYNPFNELFDSFFAENHLSAPFHKVPAVNISETDAAYTIELAAPGLKKDDFKLALDRNLLTISTEVKEEKTEEGKSFNRKEFSYEAFSRSFTLPDLIDHAKIDATYTDGVLYVTLAKKEEAKILSRTIEVK